MVDINERVLTLTKEHLYANVELVLHLLISGIYQLVSMHN